MHELWLCRSILEIIKQNACKNNAARVKKIVLELGQLAAVEQDALIFSFKIIAAGTVAENATLQIINIPGEAYCETCKKHVPLRQYYDACQECGQHTLYVTQGEELLVKSMVVE